MIDTAYVTDVDGDKKPPMHRLQAPEDELQPGHMKTACGVIVQFTSSNVLLPRVHAERFASPCSRCYAGAPS